MGQRKMGRDVRIGWVEDPLRLYKRHYQVIANCLRPLCENKRDLLPKYAALGEIAALLRCSKCVMRGARIRAEYVGPIGVWR